MNKEQRLEDFIQSTVADSNMPASFAKPYAFYVRRSAAGKGAKMPMPETFKSNIEYHNALIGIIRHLASERKFGKISDKLEKFAEISARVFLLIEGSYGWPAINASFVPEKYKEVLN
ncbi:MAG: hypothetical protein KJ955_03155 [Nanoarchaeota archaeon]|nr:hypothetical protein [Nanoarchaeota archaeon]